MNKEQEALIKKIKEIHGKATQGEWADDNFLGISEEDSSYHLAVALTTENAQAIAFYHNNILELVRIIEEFKKKNKKLYNAEHDALNECQRLLEQNKEMKEALKKLEWVKKNGIECCPNCRNQRYHNSGWRVGHTEGCVYNKDWMV